MHKQKRIPTENDSEIIAIFTFTYEVNLLSHVCYMNIYFQVLGFDLPITVPTALLFLL